MSETTQIRSPRGIRFDCSGCSNCCLQWPVPISREDYDRISNISMPAAAHAVMRSLKSSRENLLAFTHTLEKQADGSCAYLNQDKRCLLHLEYGAASKPSMCRLFPYTFMVTPDAVLASLSFASTAVLYNTGTLLSEQPETLETQYEIFKSLFKPRVDLWQQIQLIDGIPMSWTNFSQLDQELSSLIESDSKDLVSKAGGTPALPGSNPEASGSPTSGSWSGSKISSSHEQEPGSTLRPLPIDRFAPDGTPSVLTAVPAAPALTPRDLSRKLKQSMKTATNELPNPQLAEREPRLEARPKIVDQIILKHLERLYFPQEVFREDRYDFDAKEMLKEIVSAPDSVSFGQGNNERKFSELIKQKLSRSEQINELFDRFLYLRFFSKMYFGPGFHHLSLISGLNHLRILFVLLRLKLKQMLCSHSNDQVSFEDACELVRTLERRLTQLDLSKESQTLLEVLLTSPSRQERITFLAE